MGKFEPPLNMEKFLENYSKSADYINSWNNYINNPTGAPDNFNLSERAIRDFLSRLGNVQKLPESKEDNDKSPDFLLEKRMFAVEVKSINTIIGKDLGMGWNEVNFKNDKSWREKIVFTIKDMEKKFTKKYDAYKKLGAVYISATQWIMSKTDMNKLLCTKNILGDSSLDALLVYFEKTGGNVENLRPFLIAKDESVAKTFREAYEDGELTVSSPQTSVPPN